MFILAGGSLFEVKNKKTFEVILEMYMKTNWGYRVGLWKKVDEDAAKKYIYIHYFQIYYFSNTCTLQHTKYHSVQFLLFNLNLGVCCVCVFVSGS